MQNEDPNLCWNALWTRHQHERKVETLLSAKGFETFLPTYECTRRWKDRNKKSETALFPGYLFVANAHVDRLRVIVTEGVCGIVSVAGSPAAISNQEIESIRKTVSDPAKVMPHPFLVDGDNVTVQRGPLAGVRGILVRRKDSYRLVVSIGILGRAASVEIDANHVEKANRERVAGLLQKDTPLRSGTYL